MAAKSIIVGYRPKTGWPKNPDGSLQLDYQYGHADQLADLDVGPTSSRGVAGGHPIKQGSLI